MQGEHSSSRSWLHCYAVFSVAFTLVLISIGGLVTSKGVGMAVPDWPTTFGYNMFYFPISKWEGGIFHEHVHRLVASAAGFFTICLVVCAYLSTKNRALRKLGWLALGLVIFQGTLGGLRVVLDRQLVGGVTAGLLFGLAHAITAQIYLSTLGIFALMTSRHWAQLSRSHVPDWLVRAVTGLAVLIFAQLMIAAAMRHQHAGLAIPDFPTAYGEWYPPTDADSLARINQKRTDFLHDSDVTAFQIHLQMAHRIVAVLIVVGVIWTGMRAWTGRRSLPSWALRLAGIWVGLVVIQFFLGAATIWTNKAADIATAHVVVGAMSLLTGVLYSVMALRVSVKKPRYEQESPCGDGEGLLQNGSASPVVR